MKTEHHRLNALQPNDDGIGSHCEHRVDVEWTPEASSSVPIKSTWRDAIGPALTNRRINQHIRAGWYGEARRRNLLEQDKRTHPASDIVFRCACGAATEVRFYRWSYLPKAGYYCPRCIASYRSSAERERKQTKEFNERVLRARMERYV